MKSLYESVLSDDFENEINGVAQQLVMDKFELMTIAFDDEHVYHVHPNEVFKNTLNTEVKKRDWDIPDSVQKAIERNRNFEEMMPFVKVVMHMQVLGWKQNFASFLRNYLKSGWHLFFDEKESNTLIGRSGLERIYINFQGPKDQNYDLYMTFKPKHSK